MPPFPSSFPPKRELITTFDFVDIANGLGYEVFWLIASKDSTSLKLGLTNLNLVSDRDGPSSSTGTLSFDTSVFNLPRTVKGTLLANILLSSSATVNNNTYSIKIQVVHSDDSTTDISSTISNDEADLFSSTVQTFLMEIPLTQRTIKKGEKIRAIITTTPASGTMHLEHNGSESRLNIPFRIDNI